MFEQLFESLKKPFLTNPAVVDDTTITTAEDYVEKTLGDVDVEFPKDYTFGKRKLTEREKMSLEERADAYIRQYRLIESLPEVSSGIDEIVNEAINVDIDGSVIPDITFDDHTNIKDNTKKAVQEEWTNVMKILDFKDSADELFRKWYVDGKLICEVVYKDNTTKEGIQTVLQLSPFGFRKRQDPKDGKSYYMYQEQRGVTGASKAGRKDYYDPEQIVISTSGLKQNNVDIGYLFSAIKPTNNMSMIEDSFVIYRLLRAVETRIWNVNVGKMPKNKAESYLNKVIGQIKSELAYNPTTGEFDGRASMSSLINDYVFPSRGNGESTSVSTIGGDTSFVDNAEDHKLFLKKLYIALKIPVTRLDADSSTMDFTSTDILRAEMKFTKFVNKLRRKFSQFLLDILKLQMISKGLIDEKEWQEIKSAIIVKWNSQNEIIELAQIENFKKKTETIVELEANGILGKFMSYQTAMKEVMGMTPEQFEEEKKLIEKEKTDGYFFQKKAEDENI